MHDMPTAAHRLADALLAVPLADYVTTHRQAKMSWRLIARQLAEDTNGVVDVTAETLRNWFPEVDAAEQVA